MTNTANTTDMLISEISAILAADEWRPRWGGWTKALEDTFGNAVSIHEDDATIRVEFEYAIPGVVETLHLDPSHGARRIALTILALATPQE